MSSGYPPYGGMQSLPCPRCHAPLLPNEANCRNCGYSNASPQGNISVATPSAANGSWNQVAPQVPYGQGQSQQGAPSWSQFPVPPSSTPSVPSPQVQNTFNTPPSATVKASGKNFFGGSAKPPSVGEGNGYSPNQPVSPVTPPPFAPQRPSGMPSTGPMGPQSFSSPPPAGPTAQVPYGAPPAGFQQFGAPPVQGQSFPGVGAWNGSHMQSGSIQPFPMATPAAPSSPALSRLAQPASKETRPTRRIEPKKIILIAILLIALVGGGTAGYILLNNHNTIMPTTVDAGVQKGAPLFADAFKNNANGWSLQADPGRFSISLGSDSLILEDDINELLWEPLPGNKTFSDFTLSVDAMLAQGDQTNGYGIYIRGSSVQNAEMATYYRFELYGDGTYAIFKGALDANGNPTNSKLVDYTPDPAIKKQGAINHVTITAKGSSLSLTVNGQMVKTITDSSYVSGAIAPFVSNMQNARPGAQARFSNLTISAA